MKKEYITFNPDLGWPSGFDLYYECLRCNDIIKSTPSNNTNCKCGNIFIDVDSGRLSINRKFKIRLFKYVE